MRHTARIGRTSFWAKAVGCAMGRGDSVLRRGEGRAGARERCPRRETGSRAGGNARPGSEMAEWGERPRGRGRGSCLEEGPIPGPKRQAPGSAQRGAARLMEGDRGEERSRTSDRHRQTRS